MRELKAVLGGRDIVVLTLGTVIGSGIFLVPGTVLQQVGESVPVAAGVWVIGGVLSVLGALSYAELGVSRPTPGGLYVYLREVFGERIAFLFGWAMFLIVGSGTIAALSVAFAAYVSELVPLSHAARQVTAVALIAAIATANALGTQSSMNTMNLTTAIKIGGLLLLSAILFALGPGLSVVPSPIREPSVHGCGLAMVSVLWAYQGWQWVLFSAGEIRTPQRSVPRGLLIGTVVLVIVYLVTNAAYLAALGPDRMASSTRVAAEALAAIHQYFLAKLVAVLILVSITSSANGTLLTTSRIYYAMARDGLIFRSMGALSPSRDVPTVAILASAGWAAILALSGTFEQLLSYVVSVGWAFYALGAACVFGYRRLQPDLARPYRVPGYPVTPALFITASIVMLVDAAMRQPRDALVGLAVILIGTLVHAWWRGVKR
jgi:basic amino acid/polyamine antiporter, APA family